jgi:hypothetical protein
LLSSNIVRALAALVAAGAALAVYQRATVLGVQQNLMLNGALGQSVRVLAADSSTAVLVVTGGMRKVPHWSGDLR